MPIRDELPPAPPDLSRRDFTRLLGLGAAGLTLPRGSLEGHFARQALGLIPPANAIRLNANENPLGPSPAAMRAIAKLGPQLGRYPFQAEDALGGRIAELEGLPATHVEIFMGSSDPLHRAMLAYTGPEKAAVHAEPGYEAPWRACKVTGARAVAVPLTPALAHDVRAMCAAEPAPGVVYICSPNNPTGTVTPRDEIVWALNNKPAGSLLVVDEAYIHFCDEPSMAPLVASHDDLLVLRTYSKLYGMAGMRLGVAIAQPTVLDRLRTFGMLSASAGAIVAAQASLDDPRLVPDRRAETRRVREETFEHLDRTGHSFHRSEANCFMLDAKRPPTELVAAMAERGVIIGRSWPVWPQHVRVTVGTRDEMKTFCKVLDQVSA